MSNLLTGISKVIAIGGGALMAYCVLQSGHVMSMHLSIDNVISIAHSVHGLAMQDSGPVHAEGKSKIKAYYITTHAH